MSNVSNNKPQMNPSDQTPAAHLRGSGIKTTRSTGKLPRASNKAASRPSKGPKSGGPGVGRITTR